MQKIAVVLKIEVVSPINACKPVKFFHILIFRQPRQAVADYIFSNRIVEPVTGVFITVTSAQMVNQCSFVSFNLGNTTGKTSSVSVSQ